MFSVVLTLEPPPETKKMSTRQKMSFAVRDYFFVGDGKQFLISVCLYLKVFTSCPVEVKIQEGGGG